MTSLANYDFTIHYQSGKQNIDANALSRIKWQHKDNVHVKAILSRGLNADTTVPLVISFNDVHCKNVQLDNTETKTRRLDQRTE